MKLYALALCCVCVAVICLCTRQNPYAGGGGTETVVGALISEDGSSAAQTRVELLPADYDPLLPDTLRYNYVAIANESGGYCFKNVPMGEYTLLAILPGKKNKAIKSGIVVAKGKLPDMVDTLRVTGTVIVALPGNIATLNGYIYVPGTSIAVSFGANSSSVMLDSVPAGVLPSIVYRSINGTGLQVIRYRVLVSSNDTTEVKNPAWHYARQLYFNTTASGANVNNAVRDFPVLIRLTKDNINFAEAAADGKDIRFRKSNDTPLPYEIERWDPVAKLAELWVKVDTIYGNDSAQSIMMYWGNSNATSQSDPASVFDTTLGFAGVWHLGMPVGTTVPDATANGNNGTTTATATVAGAIGMAQMFNGTSSLIRTSGSAMDKLNFPDSGTYSVSAWVKTNVLDSLFHGVVYKSNFEYGLQMRPKSNWEFFTYIDKTRWEMSRFPVETDSWYLLSGVRRGNKQYLYVNGVCLDSTIVVVSTNISRVYDQPLEIGHCPDGGTDPDRYFNGVIDEVRISSVAYSADWIKLCYINQKLQDELIKW